MTVDHIDAQIPTRIAAEIQADQGHDVIQYIAPLSQFEPSVLDLKDIRDEATKRWGQRLELSKQSNFNPATGRYRLLAGLGARPGDHRVSLWQGVGLPNGAQHLGRAAPGRRRDQEEQGDPARHRHVPGDRLQHGRPGLMWSYGASVQDENEQVVISSGETGGRRRVHDQAVQAGHDRRGLLLERRLQQPGPGRRQALYILNSISASCGPPRVPTPTWPTTSASSRRCAGPPTPAPPARALQLDHPQARGQPRCSRVPALLHRELRLGHLELKLYDFPAWAERVPQLDGWLAKDPYEASPADKLAFLKDATSWSTNIGYQGPSNTAIGEVFQDLIPNMFASAAREPRPRRPWPRPRPRSV